MIWKSIKEQTPPQGMIINTKIDDEHGERNIQELKLEGNLWFVPDGSTYVYYSPTHWKY